MHVPLSMFRYLGRSSDLLMKYITIFINTLARWFLEIDAFFEYLWHEDRPVFYLGAGLLGVMFACFLGVILL